MRSGNHSLQDFNLNENIECSTYAIYTKLTLKNKNIIVLLLPHHSPAYLALTESDKIRLNNDEKNLQQKQQLIKVRVVYQDQNNNYHVVLENLKSGALTFSIRDNSEKKAPSFFLPEKKQISPPITQESCYDNVLNGEQPFRHFFSL